MADLFLACSGQKMRTSQVCSLAVKSGATSATFRPEEQKYIMDEAEMLISRIKYEPCCETKGNVRDQQSL